MPTTLCIDFGNTRCKYSVFQDGEAAPAGEHILSEPLLASVHAAFERHTPQTTVLCSVIDHNPAVDQYLASRSAFLRVSAKSQLPIGLDYQTPGTLGPDRIAIAAGAAQKYPGRPLLVIACGTCVTYNFINTEAQFLGGAISPGLRMRFAALHDYTHKLPHCEPIPSIPLIGTDTQSSIQSGVINGITAELDGIIDRYRLQYDNLFVILCGGDAENLKAGLRNLTELNNHLLFIGLRAIAEHHFKAERSSSR